MVVVSHDSTYRKRHARYAAGRVEEVLKFRKRDTISSMPPPRKRAAVNAGKGKKGKLVRTNERPTKQQQTESVSSKIDKSATGPPSLTAGCVAKLPSALTGAGAGNDDLENERLLEQQEKETNGVVLTGSDDMLKDDDEEEEDLQHQDRHTVTMTRTTAATSDQKIAANSLSVNLDDILASVEAERELRAGILTNKKQEQGRKWSNDSSRAGTETHYMEEQESLGVMSSITEEKTVVNAYIPTLFAKKKFITSEDELTATGKVAMFFYKQLSITDKQEQERWWCTVKRDVRKAIDSRRSTVTSSIKNEFMSKYVTCAES